MVGARVVGAGVEGAAVAVFGVEGDTVLGAVVVQDRDVGARVVGAGVEGAGVAGVGVEDASVLAVVWGRRYSRMSRGCLSKR